jgi:23S rRNA G2069 N7-methylase RlmK/C1962 C5-methylase RlmI
MTTNGKSKQTAIAQTKQAQNKLVCTTRLFAHSGKMNFERRTSFFEDHRNTSHALAR